MKNIIKLYAIYFRFNEIINDIRQRYGKIHDLTNIHRQIADEFGYEAIRRVTDAINYIRTNRTSPQVKKAMLLFSEERINYWEKYNSTRDLYNIEIISKNIQVPKNNTRTPFLYYFIYMRYTEITPPNSVGLFRILHRGEIGDAYDKIADEFYYTSFHSIRNIIKKIEKLTPQFKIKKNKTHKRKKRKQKTITTIQLKLNYEHND